MSYSLPYIVISTWMKILMFIPFNPPSFPMTQTPSLILQNTSTKPSSHPELTPNLPLVHMNLLTSLQIFHMLKNLRITLL